MKAAESLARRARWRWPEIVFWLVAVAAIAAPVGKHLILNEIAILALFALSLDLILGYAGLICKYATPDPVLGLLMAMVLSAVLGLLTSLLVLRGSDLTRLMVTLGVA